MQTSFDIKEPGLNVLPLGVERHIVNGGGLTGQAGAIRLGISRALLKVNNDYRTVLKEKGFLTRDARKVERKKPGQPGARKNFQFSKR